MRILLCFTLTHVCLCGRRNAHACSHTLLHTHMFVSPYTCASGAFSLMAFLCAPIYRAEPTSHRLARAHPGHAAAAAAAIAVVLCAQREWRKLKLTIRHRTAQAREPAQRTHINSNLRQCEQQPQQQHDTAAASGCGRHTLSHARTHTQTPHTLEYINNRL